MLDISNRNPVHAERFSDSLLGQPMALSKKLQMVAQLLVEVLKTLCLHKLTL